MLLSLLMGLVGLNSDFGFELDSLQSYRIDYKTLIALRRSIYYGCY